MHIRQPEWCIANNGSLFASCIAAGIYATNTAEACHYITQHSHCEVVVLDGNKQLEKYINLTAKDYPSLKALVVYAEDVLDQVRNIKLSPLKNNDVRKSGVGSDGVGWDEMV